MQATSGMSRSDSADLADRASVAADESMFRLRAARDAALREAEAAVRATTRLTRLLTILSEPAPAALLLDRVMSALSELFSADIVVLLDPGGTGTYCPLAAIGIPDDRLNVPWSAAENGNVRMAMAARTPILTDPVGADQGADPQLRELGAQTAVWLPVVGTHDARGTLMLARCHRTPFLHTEVDLLTAMAYRIALVLEQTQRSAQLEQIVGSGREISRLLDEPGICAEAVRTFPAIVRAHAAAVILRKETGELSCVAQSGIGNGGEEIWDRVIGTLLAEGVPLALEPCSMPDLPCPREAEGPPATPPHRCCMLAVPIRCEKLGDGVLLAARASSIPFPPDATQIAQLYAGQISAALRNARLYRAVRDELAERKRAELALRASEQELAKLAFRDSLTGLANQACFRDQLEATLRASDLHGRSVAVVFLDLDNFKIVNDSLGHAFGNQVLCVVAERIHTCLDEGDTAARLGGDEFTILIRDVTSAEQVVPKAKRLLAALRAPIRLAGRDLFVGGSMGIAISEPGRDGPDDLLRKADLAMYRAKNNGRGCYAVFDAQLNAAAVARLELEIELRHALDRNQLRVFYQPIVSLHDRCVREVEALVRWQHPERGLVSPAEIIPIAEETGLIIELGQWVLEESCRSVRSWQEKHPHRHPLTLSVNLSTRQFRHPDLVREVRGALQQSSLKPSQLMIEITETILIHDPDEAIAKLMALKALGVRLAIDDFGTGYSSLSYLKAFPVDTLKMDRSFVQGIDRNPRDKAIARSIMALAEAFGLRVVAEGILTEGQVEQLRSLGCQNGQGYLFSCPVPAERFEAIWQERGAARMRSSSIPAPDP